MAPPNNAASIFKIPVGGRAGEMVTRTAALRYQYDKQLQRCGVGGEINHIVMVEQKLVHLFVYMSYTLVPWL